MKTVATPVGQRGTDLPVCMTDLSLQFVMCQTKLHLDMI